MPSKNLNESECSSEFEIDNQPHKHNNHSHNKHKHNNNNNHNHNDNHNNINNSNNNNSKDSNSKDNNNKKVAFYETDLISVLANLYGSQEDFIKEY